MASSLRRKHLVTISFGGKAMVDGDCIKSFIHNSNEERNPPEAEQSLAKEQKAGNQNYFYCLS